MNSKVIVCKSDPYILLYTMTWNYECGIYHIYLKLLGTYFCSLKRNCSDLRI